MSKALTNLVGFQREKRSKPPFSEVLIFLVVLAICALAYRFTPGEKTPEPLPSAKAEPAGLHHPLIEADVQMALILDTSASMDGLIRQAREQILEITSDLQTDENGKKRTLALALYRYGSSGASSEGGYIQCLVPLTTEHQSIVEALSWLRAAGTEEYAPMAITTAVEELAWDPDPKVPKVIVIVGNETFAAGPKGTQAAIDLAKEKKIRILPIYCVGQQASTSAVSGWRRAASLAGAELEMIDPNLVVAELEKPIDQEVLNKLAEEAEKQRQEDQERVSPIHPHPFRTPRMREIPKYRPASAARKRNDFGSGVRRGMMKALKTY